MAQPRLAYAGVVELPQEICHLPWPDEEPLKQDDITCDPPREKEISKEALAPVNILFFEKSLLW